MDKSGSENLLMSGGDRTGSRTAPGSDPHAELFGFPLTTSQQPAQSHCTLENPTHPPTWPAAATGTRPPAICPPTMALRLRHPLSAIRSTGGTVGIICSKYFHQLAHRPKYPSFPDHRICLSFSFLSSATLLRGLRIGSNIKTGWMSKAGSPKSICLNLS